MRRAIGLFLLSTVLLLAGCVPFSGQVIATTSSPVPGLTALPATLVPAVTQPATPAAATAQPVTAAPEPATVQPNATTPATAAPAPATSAPRAPATVSAGANGIATFTSTVLGITFQYLPEQNGIRFVVQEAGDRVYVYNAATPAEQGQWVEVYAKAPGDSLADAIKTRLLQGYSLQDCLVTDIPNPEQGQQWPAGYTFARIAVPTSPNDDLGTLGVKAAKCPQPYAAVGGLAYFVADRQHPDRFAFFSIGQYAILAGDQRPWQTTLRFLDRSGGPTAVPPATAEAATYRDDRSTAQAVLQSYVSAVNLHQYSRAYAYWSTPSGAAGGPPPFDQFAQGFADTATVRLVLGAVGGDVGAGQLYYTVPTGFVVRTRGGATQTFAGCYILHLARPELQAVPPFHPLGIQSASVRQVANDVDLNAELTQVCQDSGMRQVGPAQLAPSLAPGDVSASAYVDDRSDGVQVVRSLFNAINRKEYARAYSYWQSQAGAPGGPPPFDQFQAGYADTQSVQLAVGRPSSNAGAGQIYYEVPVTLVAQATGGKQTFVGCYTLHLANPNIQMEPPFEPLGIIKANVRQVANDADTAAFMAQSCQG